MMQGSVDKHLMLCIDPANSRIAATYESPARSAGERTITVAIAGTVVTG